MTPDDTFLSATGVQGSKIHADPPEVQTRLTVYRNVHTNEKVLVIGISSGRVVYVILDACGVPTSEKDSMPAQLFHMAFKL